MRFAPKRYAREKYAQEPAGARFSIHFLWAETTDLSSLGPIFATLLYSASASV